MTSQKKNAWSTPTEFRAKVSEINSFFRTMRMNQKYYAVRLHKFKWRMAFADIVIAFGTSSSMASWGLWKFGRIGPNAWAFIAGAAAFLSLLKAAIPLRRELERFSKLHIGYCGLYYDLEQITMELRTTHTLTPATWLWFQHLLKKNKELGLTDDSDAERDQELLDKCWNEVLKEMPKGRLWLPRTSEITTGGTDGN